MRKGFTYQGVATSMRLGRGLQSAKGFKRRVPLNITRKIQRSLRFRRIALSQINCRAPSTTFSRGRDHQVPLSPICILLHENDSNQRRDGGPELSFLTGSTLATPYAPSAVR